MSAATNPGRFAGALYLLTSIVGFFEMGHVPSTVIAPEDAVGTAGKLATHAALFRLGIVAQLIGQAGFMFVALALYDLLKGVNRRHASLMVLMSDLDADRVAERSQRHCRRHAGARTRVPVRLGAISARRETRLLAPRYEGKM